MPRRDADLIAPGLTHQPAGDIAGQDKDEVGQLDEEQQQVSCAVIEPMADNHHSFLRRGAIKQQAHRDGDQPGL